MYKGKMRSVGICLYMYLIINVHTSITHMCVCGPQSRAPPHRWHEFQLERTSLMVLIKYFALFATMLYNTYIHIYAVLIRPNPTCPLLIQCVQYMMVSVDDDDGTLEPKIYIYEIAYTTTFVAGFHRNVYIRFQKWVQSARPQNGGGEFAIRAKRVRKNWDVQKHIEFAQNNVPPQQTSIYFNPPRTKCSLSIYARTMHTHTTWKIQRKNKSPSLILYYVGCHSRICALLRVCVCVL